MWVNTYLPSLRRQKMFGIVASAGLVAAAIITKLLLPGLPPFLTLFPALLFSALLGGRWIGRIALVACLIAGWYFVRLPQEASGNYWQFLSLAGFAVSSALIVLVVELLNTAIDRLQIEKEKMDFVLRAADAATWALYPDGQLRWDDNFFRIVGLEPGIVPPSPDAFLSMVHPDDRPKMSLALSLMKDGQTPEPADQYRLYKADGSMVWLENRRLRIKGKEFSFVGITQDITRRKASEERIDFLLRELAHRVKNQLAVVTKIAQETSRQSGTPEQFSEVFSGRMQAIAKSHDMLVQSPTSSVDLAALLKGLLSGFGCDDRVGIDGPPLAISSSAVQYLAMAFHELATNALKHGALSNEQGRVSVKWNVAGETFSMKWEETGGPPVSPSGRSGFGTTVLLRLTPSALMGTADITVGETGFAWQLDAPAIALS